MNFTTSELLLLAIASIMLAAMAVLIDRLNFPQRPFRGKAVELRGPGPHRDRTGAHIIDVENDQ